MKKLIKILPILMTVMMVFMAVSPVFASVGGVSISPDTQTAQGQLGNTPNRILGIIQVVGTVIAVGVLMVLGIKYMMGSAQEKAEYKKTFIPYVIGAILLFAAVNIANMVVNFAQSI
jgi:type IV secretory pathway VirB2 component (pilin)